MRSIRMIVAGLVGATLILSGTASAQGDFSPKMTFGLSNKKVKANPSMTVELEQDDGEEELKHVTLKIPRGFSLPPDAAIENGEVLGEGQIFIAAGPSCRPDFPQEGVKQAIIAPATLEERDRTDDEADSGVYAVWVLDISGVTSVTLTITGSKATGFTLDGDVPPNDNTCPPFRFELTVNDKSGTTSTPILKNPRKPGKKKFSAQLFSLDSPAIAVINQIIKITR